MGHFDSRGSDNFDFENFKYIFMDIHSRLFIRYSKKSRNETGSYGAQNYVTRLYYQRSLEV